jgi:hypothetical protein
MPGFFRNQYLLQVEAITFTDWYLSVHYPILNRRKLLRMSDFVYNVGEDQVTTVVVSWLVYVITSSGMCSLLYFIYFLFFFLGVGRGYKNGNCSRNSCIHYSGIYNSSYFLYQDHSGLVCVARALWGLKSVYGEIPNTVGQGRSVRKLLNMLTMFAHQFGQPPAKQVSVSIRVIIRKVRVLTSLSRFTVCTVHKGVPTLYSHSSLSNGQRA